MAGYHEVIYTEKTREAAKKKISEGDSKHVLEKIAKGASVSEALNIEKAKSGEICFPFHKTFLNKPEILFENLKTHI